MNLLKYVSNFKNSFSKACEAAGDNFQSALRKRNKWYDVNIKERNFEPGDSVPALSPIFLKTFASQVLWPIYCKQEDQ